MAKSKLVTDELREVHSHIRRFCASDPMQARKLARTEFQRAREMKDATAMALGQITLGICDLYLRRYNSAEQSLRSGADYFEAAADDWTTASALRFLGMACAEQDEQAKALQLYQESLRRAERSVNTIEIAYALNALGTVHKDLGFYERALGYLLRCLQICEEHTIVTLTSAVHHNLATIYDLIGDIEAMREHNQRAIPMCEANGDLRGLAHSYLALGISAHDDGNADGALDQFRAAEQMFKTLRDNLGIAFAMANSGVVHMSRCAWSDASVCFHDALKLARHARNRRTQCGILYYLARIDDSIEKPKSFIRRMQSALRHAEAIGARDMEQMIAYALADAYERQGDQGMALSFFHRYVEIHEKLVGVATQQAIHRLRMLHEIKSQTAGAELGAGSNDNVTAEASVVEAELRMAAEVSMIRGELLKSLGQRLRRIDSLTSDTHVRQLLQSLIGDIEQREQDGMLQNSVEYRYPTLYADLLRTLRRIAPNLTAMELKICTLLRVGRSTKEIAGDLLLSVRTVQHYRLSIRRQLCLPRTVDLVDHLTSLPIEHR